MYHQPAVVEHSLSRLSVGHIAPTSALRLSGKEGHVTRSGTHLVCWGLFKVSQVVHNRQHLAACSDATAHSGPTNVALSRMHGCNTRQACVLTVGGRP